MHQTHLFKLRDSRDFSGWKRVIKDVRLERLFLCLALEFSATPRLKNHHRALGAFYEICACTYYTSRCLNFTFSLLLFTAHLSLAVLEPAGYFRLPDYENFFNLALDELAN